MALESVAASGQTPAAAWRLAWSPWSRCQSSFSLALTPRLPGLFVLAEEVVAPPEAGGRRLLALFRVEAADDLARALDRLFASGSDLRARIKTGRIFVRYAVVPDLAQRDAAFQAMQNWLATTADSAAAPAFPSAKEPPQDSPKPLSAPPPLPSGF